METGSPNTEKVTCGDHGGRLHSGKPCTRVAGWGHEDQTDGRCSDHYHIAEGETAARKAAILELAPDTGNINEIGRLLGISQTLIQTYRRHDPNFRETFDGFIEARDKMRASRVEEKVFDRIMADKASPAETIFFLKNRDPERWKDIYDRYDRGKEGEKAPASTSKKRELMTKLQNMRKRTEEAPVVDGPSVAAAGIVERLRAQRAGEDTTSEEG